MHGETVKFKKLTVRPSGCMND